MPYTVTVRPSDDGAEDPAPPWFRHVFAAIELPAESSFRYRPSAVTTANCVVASVGAQLRTCASVQCFIPDELCIVCRDSLLLCSLCDVWLWSRSAPDALFCEDDVDFDSVLLSDRGRVVSRDAEPEEPAGVHVASTNLPVHWPEPPERVVVVVLWLCLSL